MTENTVGGDGVLGSLLADATGALLGVYYGKETSQNRTREIKY